jgi:hypothetical protein
VIKFRCGSCSQKLRAQGRLSGKRLRCPKCRSIVVIPASGEGESGANDGNFVSFKVGSDGSDLDPSVFDIPPKAEAPEQLSIRDDESEERFEEMRGLKIGSRIEEEEEVGERKRPWFVDIFLYPISKAGLTMLGIIIGLPLLMKVMTKVMEAAAFVFGPCYVFMVLFICLSIIVNIVMALYLYWYLALCVRDSAEGNLRAPDVLVNSPSLGDMAGQLVKLFSCFMIFVSLIYVYIAYVEGIDMSFWVSLFYVIFLIPVELSAAVGGDIIFWGLLSFSVFLFPMTLLAVVMFDSFRAFNPVVIVGSIYSTFFQYCGLVLLFCGLCVPIAITRRVVTERMMLPYFQIFPYIIRLISIYLLMVGAHLLGRFYWRYNEKLYWEV